jgi:hypothetical protein
MTITESRPSERVAIHLEFIEPFAADNQTTFTLEPSGAGTEVTWAMNGTNSFMNKVFAVFANMDTMIGGDFERGLSQLDQAAVSSNSAAQR